MKASKTKKKAKVNKFNEHDCVVLLEDILDDDGEKVERGCTGTIVNVYNRNNFAVEFAACNVVNVKAKQILVMRTMSKPPETVSAITILSAERDRLAAMSKASKGKARRFILQMAYSYNVASAFLGSLNAPERIQRYQKVVTAHGS